MALTKEFKATVMYRAQTDPEFRIGLIVQASQNVLNNKPCIAKSLLRDYVNATLGFQKLAGLMNKTPQSLMQMLSEKGNPSLENISKLIGLLRQHEGIALSVHSE